MSTSKPKEKILMLSYKFPPIGGAGVYRAVRLAGHLSAGNEFEPIVVTITEDDARAHGYKLDESARVMPDTDYEVHRFSSNDPVRFRNRLMKLHLFRPFWYFFFPMFWDEGARWPINAFEQTAELIRKHQIRLVFTTSPPFPTLYFGYRLKKELGVKWVADMRDPYTQGYGRKWPSKLHWYSSRRKERKWLSSADHVVVVTPEMKKLFIRENLVHEENITVITNGI